MPGAVGVVVSVAVGAAAVVRIRPIAVCRNVSVSNVVVDCDVGNAFETNTGCISWRPRREERRRPGRRGGVWRGIITHTVKGSPPLCFLSRKIKTRGNRETNVVSAGGLPKVSC